MTGRVSLNRRSGSQLRSSRVAGTSGNVIDWGFLSEDLAVATAKLAPNLIEHVPRWALEPRVCVSPLLATALRRHWPAYRESCARTNGRLRGEGPDEQSTRASASWCREAASFNRLGGLEAAGQQRSLESAIDATPTNRRTGFRTMPPPLERPRPPRSGLACTLLTRSSTGNRESS